MRNILISELIATMSSSTTRRKGTFKNLQANELGFDLRPSKTKLGLNTEV